jgi:urocanate hydratase
MSEPRTIRAPRGTQLSCKNWLIEAAYRMLQNNLDPEVAEKPAELVVYGGRGQAARSWEAFDAILRSLRALNRMNPVGAVRKAGGGLQIPPGCSRVLIANSNLVPHWATQEHFDALAAKGLISTVR